MRDVGFCGSHLVERQPEGSSPPLSRFQAVAL